MAGNKLLLGALLAAGASTAQTTPPTPPVSAGAPAAAGEDEAEEIVVTGGRQPGAVIGAIPPELQLSPADIRSYGVSSITDLLAELTPQTGSVQGRDGGGPVVLLDGHRISGLAEIRDIPTEAIQRVDILPEEVALKYGYRADQKVVNFVLRKRFRAVTGELTAGTSTEGGGESGRVESDLLRIRDGGRLNLALDYRSAASLRESQRDILSTSARPYDFAGNITGTGLTGEVDPALSALAGRVVTVAAVPATAALGRPSLASFVPGANAPNSTDVTQYRTLRPATDALALNAVLAKPIGDVSASVNASFGATGSNSLRGLPGVELFVPAGNPFSPFGTGVALDRYVAGRDALAQTVAGETIHGGVAFTGQTKGWNWSLTGNYDRSNTRTTTETGLDVSAIQSQLNGLSLTLNPFATLPDALIAVRANDRAKAISNTGNLQLVGSRTLFGLPAGSVTTTVKLGGEIMGFDTDSVRSGVERYVSLSRRNGNAQVNLDIPLTSTREGFLGAVGTITGNFNYAVEQLSDFGTLTTLGYGVTWKPRDRLTLIYSLTDDEGAPTVQQLGNPQVVTPDVRVFDYRNGTTVDISQIDGGNPGLVSDNRRVNKIGLTYKPFEKTDLSLVATYIDSRTRNLTSTLPSPTAAIEAAFPDRFVRDTDGSLLSIDNRPVNFAREDKRQLRWGFNFSKPLKSTNAEKLRAAYRELRAQNGAAVPIPGAPPPGAEAARGLTQGGPPGDGQRPQGGFGGGTGGGRGPGGPGGPGGGGPGGRFGGGGPGGGGGRLQFAVYHSWVFQDDILIRPGVPVLDLLDGASSGSGGGQSRHQVEVQAGYNNDGYGARLSANWQSATTVLGGSGSGTGDLRFANFTTANLRLFANLNQIPSMVKHPWARGVRVSLAVNNLFDSKQRVRDATGLIPAGYQPDYLDPLGREVRLSIRKLFF